MFVKYNLQYNVKSTSQGLYGIRFLTVEYIYFIIIISVFHIKLILYIMKSNAIVRMQEMVPQKY